VETNREVRWEQMSGPKVAEMAKETNVALLPIGCTEMHGPHLPTGTDGIHGLAVCERAARIEPAIVLPPLFYNINDEMMEYPGVIHISAGLMVRLYHEICTEAARNGFTRIILMISHMGSQAAIDPFLSDMLERRERSGKWDYFAISLTINSLMKEEIARQFPNISDGHGGPVETSWVMAARRELVHMDQVSAPGPVLQRRIAGVRPRVAWKHVVPAGHTGDPRPADFAKGNLLLDAGARRLAEIVRELRTFDPDKEA
jgi:creatinine amidohydrolase